MSLSEQPLQAEAIVALLKKAGLLLRFHMPNPQQTFAGYTSDSRRVEKAGIFIAYRGVKTDAHEHLASLLASDSALGIIYDRAEHDVTAQRSSFSCLVSDSREAWAHLAAYRWGDPQDKLRFLGVTGTNGKTSTVWFIRQILLGLGLPCLTLGTLGVYCGDEQFPASHTTPDPDDLFRYLALARERGIGWVAMEVSSHAMVQKRLGPLSFDGVAFTSFSRDHLDFHASMAEYFAAKWELFTKRRRPGAAAWLSSSLGSWRPAEAEQVGCRTYGPAAEKGLDLAYQIESMTLAESRISMMRAEHIWTGTLKFGGHFALDNFAAAFALVESVCGLALSGSAWPRISPVPGRFEPIVAAELAVIVDYAHTPDALDKTLAKLRELCKGQLWVVFGCGGDRDRGKRPLMGKLAEERADRVVLTSDNPRSENPAAILEEIAAGLKEPLRAFTIVDRRQAIAFAINEALPGDAILIAGKGHEDYQLIGKESFPFDDKKVAAEFLKKLSRKKS